MRKKETKKHKEEVKKVYASLRAKALILLKNNHKREYFKLLNKQKKQHEKQQRT